MLCVLIVLAGRLDVVAADSTQARVRVLIAVPDTQGITVVLGGGHLTDNAAYRTLSTYQTLTQGQYDLKIYPQNRTDQGSVLYTRTITLNGAKDYTITLTGTQANKELIVTVNTDDNTVDANKTRVRFGNAQRGTNEVVLATQGTNVVIGRARYGQTADYILLDPGTYSLFVNDSNSKVVTTADVNFAPGAVVSIFLLGPGGDATSSALLINVDGGTVNGSGTPAASIATVLSTRSGPTSTPPPGYRFDYVTNTPGPGGGQTGGNTGDFPTSTPNANATATISLGTAAPAASEIASASLRRAALPVTPCRSSTCAFFSETNHAVANGFKMFWDKNGGRNRYGMPLTEEYQDTSYIDGKLRTVQYFERTRLEYFPENRGKVGEVQETSLGREVLRLLGISG